MSRRSNIFLFPLGKCSSSESASQASEENNLRNILGEDLEVKLEPPTPNSSSKNLALNFLIKTRDIIINYGNSLAKFVGGEVQNSGEKEIKGSDFLDFESETEEIEFSSDDYINTLTKPKISNPDEQKINPEKKFKSSNFHFEFDLSLRNPTKRLHFLNFAIRRIFNKLVVLNNGRDNSKKIKKIKVFSCRFCNKNFDDGRKLGGHISKFHSFKMHNFTL